MKSIMETTSVSLLKQQVHKILCPITIYEEHYKHNPNFWNPVWKFLPKKLKLAVY